MILERTIRHFTMKKIWCNRVKHIDTENYIIMEKNTNLDLSHILNHLGEERENYFHAVSPPIVQTSNFAFPTIDDFRKRFVDELGNHVYSRGNNPTVAILRKKLAALEKAEDALVFGSGSGAVANAVLANVQAGDHIVCVQSPYSWTYKLLVNFLARFEVEHTFVDGTNLEEIEKAIQANTKVLYLESPNSLTFELQDLRACAALAKQHNLVTMIDNSHCSPYYQNPIEYGIDIVIHSGTKYLNGHSDVVVGVVCSNKAMIQKIFSSEYMTLGGILSPNDAFLVMRGLRTLALRMERSNASCHQLATWLEQHPKVEKIYYPFSPNSPQYELAQQQMRGNGGLFSVDFKTDSIEKMEAFFERLQRFLFAVSWGGHESLILPICAFYNIDGFEPPAHPWTRVRFYVGLEDADLLQADLEQAMEVL